MSDQAVAAEVVAAAFWSGSAVNATPHFRDDLSVDLELADTARSLRFRKSITGKAYAYIPVNVPHGTSLRYIEIMAQCAANSKNESIVAEIFRISRLGSAQVLGTVKTVAKKEGSGIHMWSEDFPIHTVDAANYSYYVRVTINRTATTSNPGLFGVIVAGRCHPEGPVHCPPGPPWPTPI
jgi:hypothetical protein